jgi:hypothetical protein
VGCKGEACEVPHRSATLVVCAALAPLTGCGNGTDAREPSPSSGERTTKDELILGWGSDAVFGLHGEHPTRWWITDGTTAGDRTSFTTTGFVPRSP